MGLGLLKSEFLSVLLRNADSWVLLSHTESESLVILAHAAENFDAQQTVAPLLLLSLFYYKWPHHHPLAAVSGPLPSGNGEASS